MKVGLDLHGVSFDCPQFFSLIGELLVAAGHEVHIITGSIYDDELEERMRKCGLIKGKSYSHFFSITQHHLDEHHKVRFDEKGDPWMDEEQWNRTKAEYCKREGITVHFDDQKEYLDYFETPNCLFTYKPGSIKNS